MHLSKRLRLGRQTIGRSHVRGAFIIEVNLNFRTAPPTYVALSIPKDNVHELVVVNRRRERDGNVPYHVSGYLRLLSYRGKVRARRYPDDLILGHVGKGRLTCSTRLLDPLVQPNARVHQRIQILRSHEFHRDGYRGSRGIQRGQRVPLAAGQPHRNHNYQHDNQPTPPHDNPPVQQMVRCQQRRVLQVNGNRASADHNRSLPWRGMEKTPSWSLPVTSKISQLSLPEWRKTECLA